MATITGSNLESIADKRVDEDTSENNVRLARLSEALARFLELIDHRATPENVASALPYVSPDVLEDARCRFVAQLKENIQAEKDTLVQTYDLAPRLAELQVLVNEADERNARGLHQGSDELKDAWRPTLDISTAIHARIVPDQRRRVCDLEAELARLEDSNALAHKELNRLVDDARQRQRDATSALDTLTESIDAMQASTETKHELRSALDSLLAELGPRGS